MKYSYLHTAAVAAVCVLLPFAGRAQEAKPATPSSQQTPPVAPKPDPNSLTRFETRIVQYEEADKKNPPPADPLVFVGSSSIGNWKSLKTDFPDMSPINRGFGGSTIPESTHYADRIILPYKPSRIVFYAGDNDLGAGRTPERVRDDFVALATKIKAALPTTKIYFISIKPSPSRWKIHEKMEATNKMIKEYAETTNGQVVFVDVYTAMLGTDGQPRPELYREDRLHMTPEGYSLWTSILTPYLKK